MAWRCSGPRVSWTDGARPASSVIRRRRMRQRVPTPSKPERRAHSRQSRVSRARLPSSWQAAHGAGAGGPAARRGCGAARLHEAMRYSVLAGRQASATDAAFRHRPRRGTCRRHRSRRQPVRIELMHAYSLVHDDLPAMDDDDLRRGPAHLPQGLRRGHRRTRGRRAAVAGLSVAGQRSGHSPPHRPCGCD